MNVPTVLTPAAGFGHWEFDSVLGKRGSGNIHTSVERVSRYVVAVKVPDGSAKHTLEEKRAMYRPMPAHAARSITVDNGSEFAHHYKLADALAIPTYFADPYSAFQLGTNEHFDGRLRKYLPKGTSFEELSQEELDEITAVINNRLRKVLGWATPAEITMLRGNHSRCCTSELHPGYRSRRELIR